MSNRLQSNRPQTQLTRLLTKFPTTSPGFRARVRVRSSSRERRQIGRGSGLSPDVSKQAGRHDDVVELLGQIKAPGAIGFGFCSRGNFGGESRLCRFDPIPQP